MQGLPISVLQVLERYLSDDQVSNAARTCHNLLILCYFRAARILRWDTEKSFGDFRYTGVPFLEYQIAKLACCTESFACTAKHYIQHVALKPVGKLSIIREYSYYVGILNGHTHSKIINAIVSNNYFLYARLRKRKQRHAYFLREAVNYFQGNTHFFLDELMHLDNTNDLRHENMCALLQDDTVFRCLTQKLSRNEFLYFVTYLLEDEISIHKVIPEGYIMNALELSCGHFIVRDQPIEAWLLHPFLWCPVTRDIVKSALARHKPKIIKEPEGWYSSEEYDMMQEYIKTYNI